MFYDGVSNAISYRLVTIVVSHLSVWNHITSLRTINLDRNLPTTDRAIEDYKIAQMKGVKIDRKVNKSLLFR